MKLCSVKDCGEKHHSKGHCRAHHYKLTKYGDANYEITSKKCSIDGCNEKHKGKGYCRNHLNRFKKHGDANYQAPTIKICIVDGCNGEHIAKGYCSKHYSRIRNGIPLLIELSQPKICKIDGCGKKHSAKGYCQPHYDKFKRYGDANYERPIRAKICKIEGCGKKYHAKGYCRSHYEPFKIAAFKLKPGKKCIVEGCDKKQRAKQYCTKHYARFKAHGDPNTILMREDGEGCIHNGYLNITVNGVVIREHRYIMEQHLGRKLTTDENVHHKNGDRLDNRIENLEIWNTCQPQGQRIEDKLKYAKEILSKYEEDPYEFMGVN